MRARRGGSGWEVLAPAKLNLYLEVLGRRDDGFHELETLMTPVRLFDRLRWSPATDDGDRRFSLDFDPATPLHLRVAAPADSQNLVWRSVELLANAAGIVPSGQFLLEKRIPVQAGMGGASSDAAATLVLANAAWGLNFSRTRLVELAARLGSDVPFFLAGGPARCRGRGERVEPVDGLPRLNLVIVTPPVGVSTAEAFGSLRAQPVSPAATQNSQTRVDELVDNLRRGALARAARQMVNRLEHAAAALCPWIERLRAAFARRACLAHGMTGSGSAYFGIMRSARQARQTAQLLSSTIWGSKYFERADSGTGGVGTVFATATCHVASPPL